MPSEQLHLPVPPSDDGPTLHLPNRVVPMQATQVDAPFDDVDYFFEPWWPGVRAFALVERGRLRLQADGLADAAATFPEMAELLGQLGEDGVVLDGTLLVLDDDGRPDGGLLRSRLGGDATAGRPAYVASDLLWAGGQPVTRRTFRVRRRWLEALLAAGDRITVGHGYTGDGRWWPRRWPRSASTGCRRVSCPRGTAAGRSRSGLAARAHHPARAARAADAGADPEAPPAD